MVNILERAANFGNAVCQEVAQTGREMQSGILTFLSADGAFMTWKIYSLNGFLKLTRVLIADLNFLMLIPAIKEVFSKYKDALEMQKDLYYASMLSESIVKVIKLDPEGSPCGLQLPQNEDGDIDWFMLCLCISSIFDTAQFLKKYDVFSFSFYSNTMRPIGSYTKLDQVPVIQSFFDDRPKEFFVVASGFFDLYRSARNLRNLHQIQPADRDRSWTFEKWDSILAIVANFGKIIGLSCYRRSAGQMWLAVVGLLGNHAGLFRMMLFHHVARVKRNTCPAPPDL